MGATVCTTRVLGGSSIDQYDQRRALAETVRRVGHRAFNFVTMSSHGPLFEFRRVQVQFVDVGVDAGVDAVLSSPTCKLQMMIKR